ncbi:peptidoglycan editing factor PgeF [Vibrio sp. WJH972]
MITPNWNAPKNVKAYATMRATGASQLEYKGLNLGMHVGDDPNRVMQNRQSVVDQLSMPSSPVWLNQTHSTNVVELTKPTTQILDADGSFTKCSNLVCGVMTADCLPVLLCNSQGSQVAAVHAGWRGLSDGILEQALSHFNDDVFAWLGPAIGPSAFEVGEDVVEAFCQFDAGASTAFVSGRGEGKWVANIYQLATQRLNRAGIGQVTSCDLCTYNDSDSFYSYRRDGVTGRQATFIWFE